jgi:hypothetical protein
VSEEPSSLIADRFGADGRETEVIVRLAKGCTADVDRGQPIERLSQLDLINDRQHHKMTTVVGLKATACFETGVTDLHNLIGQGQIGANQRVDISG